MTGHRSRCQPVVASGENACLLAHSAERVALLRHLPPFIQSCLDSHRWVTPQSRARKLPRDQATDSFQDSVLVQLPITTPPIKPESQATPKVTGHVLTFVTFVGPFHVAKCVWQGSIVGTHRPWSQFHGIDSRLCSGPQLALVLTPLFTSGKGAPFGWALPDWYVGWQVGHRLEFSLYLSPRLGAFACRD